MGDPRDDLVTRAIGLATDRSFVDIGGVWNIAGEKCSVAHRAGATGLSLMDLYPLGSPEWKSLRGRWNLAGIPDVQPIVCDLANYDGPGWGVVHCSGVIYHHPSPHMLLEKIRSLTHEWAIVSSVTVPKHVLSADIAFVPAIDENKLSECSLHLERGLGGPETMLLGVNRPGNFQPGDRGAFWWLYTPEVLQALCETSGLQVHEAATWNDECVTTVLCSPLE